MEKLKFCETKKKEVSGEDCKICKQRDLKPVFFKVCKNTKFRIKCPKCGEVFE